MRMLLLFLAFFVLSFTATLSATWHVYPDGSGDAATINEALLLSAEGDTVLAAPGTYFESLIMRNGRTLISETGPEETIIDAQGIGRVIYCSHLENPIYISGFTLRNGFADIGAGLYCNVSTVTFEDNIVYGNSADEHPRYGGGVYLRGSPPSTIIRGNLIYGNTADMGAGIFCNGGDQSSLIGNTVVNNSSQFGAGVISHNGSDITVSQNLIAMNEGSSGFGIYIHSSSDASLTCNDVWMNVPDNYHGPDVTGIDGNISIDPIFCDVAQNDYSLDASSPCLPMNHPDGADCGQIGALGQGCELEPQGVSYSEETGVAELRLLPSPASGPVTIQYTTPGGGPVAIEIFDSSGRLIRQIFRGATETGTYPLIWDGNDNGGRASVSGVYFVRLRASAGSVIQPIVMIR